MRRPAISTSSTRASIRRRADPAARRARSSACVPAYVPKTKWSAGIQYEIPLGDYGSLTPRFDASYQGELFTNGANAETNRIGAYTLGNARLTWRSAKEDWESSIEVTNLADKYYFLTRFDQYTLTGVTDGQPGRPREWALTVKRKF